MKARVERRERIENCISNTGVFARGIERDVLAGSGGSVVGKSRRMADGEKKDDLRVKAPLYT